MATPAVAREAAHVRRQKEDPRTEEMEQVTHHPWTSMVQERFLVGNLHDDESTVWRRLRREVAEHPLATQALTRDLQIGQLLEFLSTIFTEGVIQDVQCSLLAVKESWSGWITSSGDTFSSYVEILISDLRHMESSGELPGEPANMSDDLSTMPNKKKRVEFDLLHPLHYDVGMCLLPSGGYGALDPLHHDTGMFLLPSVGHDAQSIDATGGYSRATNMSGVSSGEKGDIAREGQGFGEGKGLGEGAFEDKEEVGEDASDDFTLVRSKRQQRDDRCDQDPNDYGDGLNGRLLFQKTSPVVLTLGPYMNPPKPFYRVARSYLTPARTLNIQSRAKKFAEHPLVLACKPEFDMGVGPEFNNPHEEGATIYLFHGTRTSCVASFMAKGISPPSYALVNGDFSRLPTFYVTTKARYAFEHPLLNHDHAHQVGKECDTISVLCFKVPVSVLRGEAPPTGNHGKSFDVQYFSGEGDDWEEFCRHNHSELGSDKYYRETDITLGPVSVPGEDDRGNRVYRVLNINGCKPKQAAFSTRASRVWLAHHLIAIYEEERSQTSACTSY